MIIHLNCPPLAGGNTIILDWDPETGEMSGLEADCIRAAWAQGACSAHPIPRTHYFSSDPSRSLEDMAALLGFGHVLPAEPQGHYSAYHSDSVDDPPGLVY